MSNALMGSAIQHILLKLVETFARMELDCQICVLHSGGAVCGITSAQ